MPDIFEKVQSLAGPSMRGLAAQFAPSITKGLLIEYLGKIKIEDVMVYIEKDVSLWSQTPEYQAKIKKLTRMQGKNLSWLTSVWVIEAVRKDLPGLASMFLGWRKARNWLDKQVIELKQQINS